MKLIDLTHTFTNSMPVYPGDPKSFLEQTAFINKDTYNDHRLITQMHVGTHMDAPLHMINDGKRIDELPIESFIGKEVFENTEINNESIVLVYTGFDKFYNEPKYFDDSPFLSVDLANYLVEKKIKMVGLDFSGPDIDYSWPVHKVFLSRNIPIIENLTNLSKLIDIKKFEVIALPIKLDADGSAVRVIAKII